MPPTLRPLVLAVSLLFPLSANAQWRLISGLPGENSGSVWGTSPRDLWLSGGVEGLGRYDGSTWTPQRLPGGTNRYNVFGFSENEVYSSGHVLLRFDGASWTQFYRDPGGSELTSLWGRSGSDLFVGGDGIIRHFDGSAWTDIPTGLSRGFNVDRISSISGGRSRTFAVGWNGRILSWDGTSLVHMASGTSVGLTSVAALDDDNAFVVGGGGTILRLQQGSWNRMASPVDDDINGVFALGPNNVWASTALGSLLHFDGNSWNVIPTGFGGFMGAPFGFSSSQMYIPVAGRTQHCGSCGMLLTNDASILAPGEEAPPVVAPEPSSLALALGGAVLVALGRAAKRRSARLPA